ncbi:hypothetical protein LguiA_011949 [Lonicera macranthoides]
MEELNKESTILREEAIENDLKCGPKTDLDINDDKKFRRMMSNRLSAQRSRIRKTLHINDLENQVKDLQALNSILSPRIDREKQQQAMMQMENDFIQQKLGYLTQLSERSNAEIEEKKAEVKRLKDVLHKNEEDSLMSCVNWDTELEEIMYMSHYDQSSPPPMLD